MKFEVAGLSINPFEKDIVHKPRECPNSVATLNEDVLLEVVAAFTAVDQNRISLGSKAELIVSSAPGYGKSHLIGRLFRALDHRATQIFLTPFQTVSLCWQSILLHLVNELDYPDSSDEAKWVINEPTQLDALAEGVLQNLVANAIDHGAVKIVRGELRTEHLRQPSAISVGKGSDPSSTWIRDHFQSELLPLCQQQLAPLRLISGGWLKVLFHYLTSSPGTDIRQACLNWLRYETLDESVIQSLGLAPGENPKSEPVDTVNETCWLRIHDFCRLARYYRPFLFCFDQTEDYATNLELVRQFGRVVVRMVNELPNQLTVVTANEAIWSSEIFPKIDTAHRPRFVRAKELRGLDISEADELIGLRLAPFAPDETLLQRFRDRQWLNTLFSERKTDDIPISTAQGVIHVAGRPDCVILETNGPAVVDYKLSRGANLKTDLLQAVIYAALLQSSRPGLSISARLEYYEPKLHVIEQDRDQVRKLFDELVAPTLAELATGLLGRPQEVAKPIPATARKRSSVNFGSEIVNAYRTYGVSVQIADRSAAPQLTRYRLRMGEGVKFNQIEQHSTNLKIALSLPSEPVISAGPGFVFFDIAKAQPDSVTWSDVMNSCEFRECQSSTAFPVGIGVDNKPLIADLSDPNMAHALVAGTSGSGKSEFLKTVVATLAKRNSPSHLKFSLIDPKRLTFGIIRNSRYLQGPVLFSLEEALLCLSDAADEMDRRYGILLQEGLTKLSDRFAFGKKDIPFYVLVFDEFADLVHSGREEKKKFEALVARIAGKGRAAGIHLLLSTQRPDRETVSGLVKANLLLKVCFRVTNAVNSTIVLDQSGSEKLLGRGDFFCNRGNGLERGQSSVVSPEAFLKVFADREMPE